MKKNDARKEKRLQNLNYGIWKYAYNIKIKKTFNIFKRK